MTIGGLERRKLIRQKLAPSPDADGKAAAKMAVQTWDRVISHISPVIGDEGVRALYARTLRLTKSALAFPRFGDVHNDAQTRGTFSELQGLLEQLDPTEIGDLSSALLINFTELLATLIGEDLTTRLTQAAWTDDGPLLGHTTQEPRE